jgi:rod shape-determining protein MreD
MLKTILLFFVIFVLGIFFEGTFVKAIFPQFVMPDLVIVLVIFLALKQRDLQGLIASFFLGLGNDFASAIYVGPHAAAFVCVYVFILSTSSRIFAEHAVALFSLGALAVVVKWCVIGAILSVYTTDNIFQLQFLLIVICEAILTGIMTAIFFRLLRSSKRINVRFARTSSGRSGVGMGSI